MKTRSAGTAYSSRRRATSKERNSTSSSPRSRAGDRVPRRASFQTAAVGLGVRNDHAVGDQAIERVAAELAEPRRVGVRAVQHQQQCGCLGRSGVHHVEGALDAARDQGPGMLGHACHASGRCADPARRTAGRRPARLAWCEQVFGRPRSSVMRVLGIDPGLTRCGVGVVEGSVGRPLSLVDVGVVRTAAEMPIEERLCLIAAGLEEWLDATRPDAVAVERVFSQHNVKTVMGTAQASGIALLVAARRGLPVDAAHAERGQGLGDRQRPGRQGPGGRHGDPPAAPRRGAQARRRGRLARAGDLPHLAGRREQPDRGGGGGPEVCAQACPDVGVRR